MCFSASASFGAGIILSTIGVASIKQAQTSSQVAFAAIPLIFAIQQVTEGVLWLALPDPANASLQGATTYLFLFFAQVVWPFWVPFSILKPEKDERRKRTLKVLLGIGTVVSLYLGFCLLKYHVKADITGHHIAYDQDYPDYPVRYGGVLYIIATIVPPFFSSLKGMWTLGMAILISYIITAVFYEGYVVSVWCFFASVISIVVYIILREYNKQVLPDTDKVIAGN